MERYSIFDVEIIDDAYHIPTGWSGKRFMRWMKRFRKKVPAPLRRTKKPAKMQRTTRPIKKVAPLSAWAGEKLMLKKKMIPIPLKRTK